MSDSVDPSAFPPRGTIVHLKAQLMTPGGKYKVLSCRGDEIKLQKGSDAPVELSRAQFWKLQASSGSK
jgi:hypothetical protein